MSTKSGLTGKKMEAFLGKLSDLVGSLPSADEKARIDNDLKVLISYLEEVRKQLETMPTRGQMDGSAIDRLRELLRAVDADPLLSRVLGMSPNGPRIRRGTRVLGEDARIRAREAARELQNLPGDQVQYRLLDRSYTVALLRQIGDELGIRIPAKANRLSVIDIIAGKLANRRGYDILRHGGRPDSETRSGA